MKWTIGNKAYTNTYNYTNGSDHKRYYIKIIKNILNKLSKTWNDYNNSKTYLYYIIHNFLKDVLTIFFSKTVNITFTYNLNIFTNNAAIRNSTVDLFYRIIVIKSFHTKKAFKYYVIIFNFIFP